MSDKQEEVNPTINFEDKVYDATLLSDEGKELFNLVIDNDTKLRNLTANINALNMDIAQRRASSLKLNEELQKDGYDLSVETLKEVPKKDLTLYN